MFRQKLLDKMSTPDSLDQLLVVVTPQSQITFLSLASILVIAIVWSVVAEIPVTVDGKGILLRPHSIKTAQAVAGGLVREISASVGDTLQPGTVLVRIERPEMERQLEQQIARYVALVEFNERMLQLAKKKRDLELQLTDRQSEAFEKDIITARELKGKVARQLLELSNLQEEELGKSRDLMKRLKGEQGRQLVNINTLVKEGIAPVSRRLQAEASLTDTEGRIADFHVRIKQTQLSKIESEQRELKLSQEIGQLESQKQQLLIRQAQVRQEFELESQRRTVELIELASAIRLSREKIFRECFIRSQFHGKLLEVSISAGQQIAAGTRVAMMQVEGQRSFHRLDVDGQPSRGTFRLTIGAQATEPLPFDASAEQIQKALLALPTCGARGLKPIVKGKLPRQPIDIEFEATRPGADIATVELAIEDADLTSEGGIPALAVLSHFSAHVSGEDLRHLGFFPIGSGKKVTRGREIRINPGNVERQRFGSMVGRVIDVSPFPVTSDGIVNVVGNTDIARSLVEGGGTILVTAEIDKDAEGASGYKWTSKGPPDKVTAGTTTTCRITIEQRKPITFVIPLLRQWFLGETDKPDPKAAAQAPQ